MVEVHPVKESSTAPRASASPSRFEEDSAIPPEEKKCEEDDEVSEYNGEQHAYNTVSNAFTTVEIVGFI